jgi:RNA polymerase sigma-70 factor (ECF subfamily)
VALAVAGQHDAFQRLYRANVNRVYSLAFRMAGEESAEDLTQEVFIRAWEKLGTYRGDALFSTWLHRLAVNLILSRRETIQRRRQRFVQGSERLNGMAGRQETPGAGLDLERALTHLPEGAKQVFVLFDVEGYSHEEISELLDISQGTSKSQLHRARMMLRKHLD